MVFRRTLAAQPVGSDFTQFQQTLDAIDAEITRAALHAETAMAAKKQFEDLMVFMKAYNNHVPFESGTDDAEEGTDV